jgi:hypothetical protein
LVGATSSFLLQFSKTLNPKQQYPNLSNKGKSAAVRVIVACQKTFSKPFQNCFQNPRKSFNSINKKRIKTVG